MYFLDGVRGNSRVPAKKPPVTTGPKTATKKPLPPVFSREAREIARIRQEVKFEAPDIDKKYLEQQAEELKIKTSESGGAIGAFDVKDPDNAEEIRRAKDIISQQPFGYNRNSDD